MARSVKWSNNASRDSSTKKRMINHSLIHPRTSKFAQEAQIKKFPDFDKKSLSLNKSMNF